jgi:hypothetical protein
MDNVIQTDSIFARNHLNPVQRKRIDSTWAPGFRRDVVDQLPINDIRTLYCQDNGRPTKELKSIVGAIILQNMFNLSDGETVQRFLFDNLWIEALNLGSVQEKDLYICPKTLWSHSQKLSESGLIDTILDSVNVHLAKVAKVDLDIQRLDSVHIRSNMAKLTRIQLFHRTTKKFLRDLELNHKELLEPVDPSVRARYLTSDKENKDSAYHFFGKTKPGERQRNLEMMASDIYGLITLFKDVPTVAGMESFALLTKLFSEQCEVETDPSHALTVKVKEPELIPSNSLQNPSDPDATFCGHKGEGFQAQLMETCAETKEEGADKVSLITYVKFEPTHEHDAHALIPAIEGAEKSSLKPKVVLADTSYGSDENVQKAKELGVTVVSPAGGKDPEAGKIRIAEFLQSENSEDLVCPKGQKPWTVSKTKNGGVVAGFNLDNCNECADNKRCPAWRYGHKAELKFSPKDMRLSKRRMVENTDEFKRYSMRSGIEATNSRLARETGLKRLRYRRRVKNFMAVVFKVLGINHRRVLSVVGIS